MEIVSLLPKIPRNAPDFGAGVTEAAGLLSGNPASSGEELLVGGEQNKSVRGLHEAETSLVLFFLTFPAQEGSFCTEQPLPVKHGVVFSKGNPSQCLSKVWF